MASDNFDLDWGDDPFDGDLDFDMDFDGEKKGKVRSFVTGFFSGLKDHTIGDTDARIKTLRMALPSNFSTTLNAFVTLNNTRKRVLDEIKKESVGAIGDAQYIIGRAVKPLEKYAPNKIAALADEFSKKDFSGWESGTESGNADPSMEEVQEDDLKSLLEETRSSNETNRDLLYTVGKSVTQTIGDIGAMNGGKLSALTQQVGRSNIALESIVNYQNKVQSRNDALKINILARSYLINAKFYKFMEAASHRTVRELKAIAKSSAQSDFEKTSNSQALRAKLRGEFFNTAWNGISGIKGYLKDNFGRDKRKETIGDISSVLGDVRMGLEMSEGMPLNYADMAGRAAAGFFVDSIPRMLNSDKGKEIIAKITKQYPDQADWLNKQYKKLEDLGNTFGYNVNNVEGLANTLARNYSGGFDFNEEQSYEEYVASVPAGTEPLSKAKWYLLGKAKGTANSAIGTILDNTYIGEGRQYNLAQRTLRDSADPAIWNKRSERTLTEIIPQWFSHIHMSLEKIRTGNDNIAPESYDYTSGRFVKQRAAAANMTKRIFNRNQFNGQAEQAKSQVKKIAGDFPLSTEASNALALKIAKDQANGFGFSPYNFMNLEDEGVSPKVADEIKTLMKTKFGITDEHLDKYATGTDADRAGLLTSLPTKEGRALANSVAETSKSLSTFLPDISNALDIEKGSGNYQALKAANIITSKNGYDSVNMEKFWDVLSKLIENPQADIGDQITEEDVKDLKTREMGGSTTIKKLINRTTNTINNTTNNAINNTNTNTNTVNNPAPTPTPAPVIDLTGVNDTVKSLDQTVAEFAEQIKKNAAIPEVQINFDPLTGALTNIDNKMGGLIDITTTTNTILTKILERQPQTIIKDKEKSDEEKLDQEKRSIIDRIKQTSFKDVFNSGMDRLLKAEPLVLGGLLGGLAGLAIHDPKTAALIAGGAAVMGVYGKYSRMVAAKEAADEEDLYEEGADDPILESWKLKKGHYWDVVKQRVINKWSEITGSVKDLSFKAYDVIIGATRLAKKLFTKDNKEVFLRGLNKARALAVKAFGFLDPIGRLKRLGAGVVDRFHQMDVYREGEDSPALSGRKFAEGAYYRRNESGELVVLKGWNEIDGPVYSDTGEVIITQEDYDRGLKTSMGMSINKLSALSSKAGKFGLKLLGQAKDKIISGGKKTKDAVKETFKTDFKPVVSSIDRIYYLLCKQFGFAPEDVDRDDLGDHIVDRSGMNDVTDNPVPPSPKPKDEPIQDNADKPKPRPKPGEGPIITPPPQPTPKPGSAQPKADHVRKNSFEDAERQAKAAADEKYKQDTGRIADNLDKLNGVGNGRDGEKKSKGLLGLLFGGATMLKNGVSWIAEKIFGKSILRAWTLMGKFASLGIRYLPTIGSGIASIASAVLSLIKENSLSDTLGDLGDRLGGGNDEGEGDGRRRRRRRRRGPAPRRSWGSKLMRGVKTIGIGTVIGYGADALASSGLVEEGGTVQTLANAAGTAANVYGGLQLASGVAGMFGTSLTGIAATAGSAAMTGIGALASVISAPVLIGAAATAAVGYGIYKIYKWGTDGKHNQGPIRMLGYGVSDENTEWTDRIIKLEQMLTKYVVISNGSASLSKEMPFEKVFALLMETGGEKGDLFSWFNGRFKPVYLSYMAAIDIAKYSSMESFDKSTKEDVGSIVSRVHQALKTTPPYPYKLQGKLDPKTNLMPEATTISRIEELLKKLTNYVKRSPDHVKVSDVATAKVNTEETLQTKKEELEKKLVNPTFFGMGDDSSASWGEARDARNELASVNAQLERLNKAYVPGTLSGNVDISDLVPKNGIIGPFTQFRLSAYGNDENIGWRIEAVLKLERTTENFIRLVNGVPRFTGKTGDFYNDFKEAFRVDDKDSHAWCLWFRDRFLPVLMTYMSSMNKYRTGSPASVWRSLSATAQYDIAKDINETSIMVNSKAVPIWRVVASPFGEGRSCAKTRYANKLLTQLGQLAQQAKQVDPIGEAWKTARKEDDKNHTIGGKPTDQKTNPVTGNEKTRADVGKSGQFGQYTRPSSQAGYNATANMYDEPDYRNDKPIKTDTDTSHIDLSGLQANVGEDQGVSVPKEAAEQLIIKEMVAAGYNDPKEIAEMLALTNYESGGYQRTTENMRYTSPANIVKTFGKVKNQDQARQLIEAGPVALANFVYGGWLGNTAPDDGYKYRGRGFVQLTGKANFKKFGDLIGQDLVNNPKLASTDPKVMAKLAVAFYSQNKLLQSIKNGNSFTNAARGLNGGKELPGMGARLSLYRDYHAKLVNGNLAQGDPNAATNQETNKEENPASATSGQSNSESTAGTTGTDTGGGSPLSNLPSMYGGATGGTNPNASAPGGSVASGEAFYHAADTATTATGQTTANTEGLKVKSEETTGGGPVHEGVKKLAMWIQSNIPGFWRFTALNDRYHHKFNNNSAHKRGVALDFTLNSGVNGSDRAITLVNNHLRQLGLVSREDYLIINEYRQRTANTSGGHVHVNFISPAAASKYLKAAGVNIGDKTQATDNTVPGTDTNTQAVDNTATGDVKQAYGNTPQLDPKAPLDMGVRSPTIAATAPKATDAPITQNGPMGVNPVAPPAETPAAPVTAPTQAPPVNQSPSVPDQVPTDIPVPASGNMDIDALAAALAKAIQQSNTAPTVKALGVLAELLKNIDTNTKTPGKTVKM